MASPQAEAFHEQVRAFRAAAIGAADAPPPSLEEMRAGSAMTMEMVGVMPDGLTVTDSTTGGVTGLRIDPAGAVTDRVLLYLHGGAYVLNSPHTHRKLAGALAKTIGCRAEVVEYRKAPEHQHPAALHDALAAYRGLLASGFAPNQIVVAGDSAGGGLTVALLVALRDAGEAQPAAAGVMSPWVDLEGTGESSDTKADVDLMVDRYALKMMGELFVGGGDIRDPLAASLYADLTGIAPLSIQVGGHETLLDDSTRLAVRAAHAGVDVQLAVFPEMQHVFQMAVGMLPEADDAVARLGAFLRTRLGL
jgi:epsilon-lactone hydrolase